MELADASPPSSLLMMPRFEKASENLSAVALGAQSLANRKSLMVPV